MWFVINATNRCNLTCKTCLRSEHSAEDVDLELVKLILPRFKKLGFRGVSITGGEAGMHPRFKELVGMIVSDGFILGVVSNGILYKQYIDIIKPHRERIAFMAISLDSHKKEVNDYIRGKGSFNKAVAAIKEFKKRGYFVKVVHVVNKKNIKDIDHFVSFALKLDADAVLILGTIKTPENRDLVLDQSEKKTFHERLRELKIKYKEKVLFVTSTGYYNDLIFCSNLSEIKDLTLDFKGNLLFCCDTIHKGAVLGNVKNESFEKLLQKHLKAQNMVKAARIKAVMNNNAEKSNDCNLCNKVLKKIIMD
jgi:MoaA/NifB/PqqE/SkfB family radical SAM enzyme